MILSDLHIHSNFSDGKLSIPEIVNLYGKRGFGAIAITDHLCEEESLWGQAARALQRTLTRASFPLYQEILKSEGERAWKQFGMRLIPGIEITKNSLARNRSAHLLALGIEEYISADLDVPTLCEEIHRRGGLVIAAHPVSTRRLEMQTYHLWDRREELGNSIDAWEVASGPYLFQEVVGTGMPKVASSDLHRPEQISSWKTLFECEPEVEPILDAIRRQKVDFKFYE